MKKAIAIFLFACVGCRVTGSRKSEVRSQRSDIGFPASVLRPLTSVPPRPWNLSWTPGQYTNFVVVTSPDIRAPLSRWQTYAVTSETNVQFVTTELRQYFAVYGTNPPDGQSAWGGNR